VPARSRRTSKTAAIAPIRHPASNPLRAGIGRINNPPQPFGETAWHYARQVVTHHRSRLIHQMKTTGLFMDNRDYPLKWLGDNELHYRH
jgi:hypothetical protein